MIYVIHRNNHVLNILNGQFEIISFEIETTIAKTLFSLAKTFPNELIIWCHKDYVNFINESRISDIFHHKLIIASYSASNTNYIPEEIGYVDQSVFIKINYDVSYPTWLMSSDIGGVHSELLNVISESIKKPKNFNYFVNSMAKEVMSQGVFCYSEPNLLKKYPRVESKIQQASNYELFKFVKQHYKWFWVYILTFCLVLFENKWMFLQLARSIFYKKFDTRIDIKKIDVKSNKQLINKKEVDVIIPTIGRKKYLYDVLRDLAAQTLVPRNVIIVEQNPDIGSNSELDDLQAETWPFEIKHIFINVAGACNARNLALSQITSEWIFLADDDIRFKNNLLEESFKKIKTLGVSVLNYLCLQPHQQQTYFHEAQTSIFSSGSSMVKAAIVKDLKFNMAYEFGFGEDSDFGMQIRNKGEDIFFMPNIKITHLKAPIGGFRTKVERLWDNDKIQPKPSPTIMLFNLTYLTEQQNQCYKLLLFIKYFKHQPIKNPIHYIRYMKKRWNVSLSWVEKLKAP